MFDFRKPKTWLLVLSLVATSCLVHHGPSPHGFTAQGGTFVIIVLTPEQGWIGADSKTYDNKNRPIRVQKLNERAKIVYSFYGNVTLKRFDHEFYNAVRIMDSCIKVNNDFYAASKLFERVMMQRLTEVVAKAKTTGALEYIKSIAGENILVGSVMVSYKNGVRKMNNTDFELGGSTSSPKVIAVSQTAADIPPNHIGLYGHYDIVREYLNKNPRYFSDQLDMKSKIACLVEMAAVEYRKDVGMPADFVHITPYRTEWALGISGCNRH